MKIEYTGREPSDRKFDCGVREDNNAEAIEFVVGAVQGALSLTSFAAYVKVATPLYEYADKQKITFAVDENDNSKIVGRWEIERKTTDHETVNMNLEFENAESEVVWQTYVVQLHFHRTVKADEAVENSYPTVLQDLEHRVSELEEHGGGGTGDVTHEELEQAIAEVNASIAEVEGDIPTALLELTQDSEHRTVTDTEKATYAAKSDFSGSYNDLTDKPTIPTTAEDVNAVPTTRTINGKALSGNITLTAQDVGALADSTKYGASFEFSVNPTTFILTARLKDQDGNVLGTAQTVDLPLESVVVDGSYDSATREVVLTLQSGSKIRFSVADLVSGLQTQITTQNKLNADLVDDTNSAHKFVTAQDITDWNNKQSPLTFDTSPTTGSTNPVTSGGIKTAMDNATPQILDYSTT